MAVLSLFSYSMRLNTTGWDYARLTQRARDTAEHLLGLPWTDARLAAGTHSGGAGVDGDQVIWRVVSSRVDEATPLPPGSVGVGAANLKEISITCVAAAGAGVGRRDVTLVVLKVRE